MSERKAKEEPHDLKEKLERFTFKTDDEGDPIVIMSAKATIQDLKDAIEVSDEVDDEFYNIFWSEMHDFDSDLSRELRGILDNPELADRIALEVLPEHLRDLPNIEFAGPESK